MASSFAENESARRKRRAEKGEYHNLPRINTYCTLTNAEYESDDGEGDEHSDTDEGNNIGMSAEDDIDWDADNMNAGAGDNSGDNDLGDDEDYEHSPVAACRVPSEEESLRVSPELVSAHFLVKLH